MANLNSLRSSLVSFLAVSVVFVEQNNEGEIDHDATDCIDKLQILLFMCFILLVLLTTDSCHGHEKIDGVDNYP